MRLRLLAFARFVSGGRASRSCYLAVSVVIAAVGLVAGVVDAQPPPAAANIQTIPAGSLVIAMDGKQNIDPNNAAATVAFNMRAYGLVQRLLANEIPVKWAIAAGKAKDGTDFTALAKRNTPSPQGAANLNFSGGPFIVQAAFAAQATTAINAYGNNVAVYELTEDANVDIRFTLTQRKLVAVANDGGLSGIHTAVLDEAGFIPTSDYFVLTAPTTASQLNANLCTTIVTEPHYGSDSNENTVVSSVRNFAESGGNVLAQCEGAFTYENNAAYGRFQTTGGMVNPGGSPPTDTTFPGADLAYSQVVGTLANTGGSLRNYILPAGTLTNGAHNHVEYPSTSPLRLKASVSKLLGGDSGGYVFYLGGHEFVGTSIDVVNGRRMYMNAVFHPSQRPSTCGFDISADLSMTKQASAGPVTVGDDITYTLTVTNHGPGNAAGVVVTDTLPGTVDFVSAVSSQGSCSHSAGVVTCDIDAMSYPGSDVTITIVVTTTAVGTVVNTASVTSDVSDPESDNDTDDDETFVNPLPTNTPTATNTPAATDTFTPVPTDTFTPVPTDTFTPVPTDTFTPVPTDTFTPVPTDTFTPVPTDTFTPVPTDTFTPVPTETFTAAPTDTFTPAPTDTFTPVPTETFTAAPTDTFTPVATDTFTPVPTDTFTPLPTNTATATATFSATATYTPILPDCGDGVVDPGEQCDDGNPYGGDGCEPSCTLSTACTYVHPGTPSVHYVNDTTANDGVGAAAGCAAAGFTTVQAAIDDAAVVDGDVVTVCPGTYAENVVVTKELTIGGNGAAVVQTVSGTAFDVRRSGVTIEGLTIEIGDGTAVSADAICPLGSASCVAPGRGSNLRIIGNQISGDTTGMAWQRKVDCVTIQSNVSSVSGAHIDIDQQEGAPAVLVRIVQNTLSGGGSGGAIVHTAGIGVRILGNTVQGSATAGVVVANLSAGSRIEENNILNNAGDGITMLPGSAATRVIQNNIVDNGTGLGNEASEGVVNATLNWWGSQSGPFHASKAMAAVGDEIVERNGGLNTLFIEFLCAPAPGGFPSVLGICNEGELTEEIQQVAPGREPDIQPKGRFISFVSDHDLNSDAGVTVDNADGSDEIFVLNVRPRKRGHSFCLGGTNPGAACSLSRDCPADFVSDPIVGVGVCVVITQLTHDPTGNAQSFTPRLIQKGDVVFSSTADLVGTNPDNSIEAFTWSNRAFRRLDPGDPNLVVTQRSNGIGTTSRLAQNDRGGRRVLMQSNGDPLGTNADGNTEIFLLDARKGQWTQITNTVGHENERPVTQNGRQLIFDSTADLVPGQNADGNREVFFAKFKRGTWVFEQITDTVGADNRASSVAKNGRVIVFTSNANLTGQNPDGNREVYLLDKRQGLTQITHTTVGENVNAVINSFGRFIIFESTSDVEDTGAELTNRRVHLHDRRFGTTVPISRSAFGENSNPRISRGRFVVWQSTANLTGSNSTGESVIYLYNRRKDN